MLKKVSLIILYDSKSRVLLQHRDNKTKVLPGYWAFFGGSIKKNETPLSAVRREALEELNCRLGRPRLLFEQDVRISGKIVHLYIYVARYSGDKLKLKLNEGQGWGWFVKTEISGLKMARRDKKIIKCVIERIKGQECSNRGCC